MESAFDNSSISHIQFKRAGFQNEDEDDNTSTVMISRIMMKLDIRAVELLSDGY